MIHGCDNDYGYKRTLWGHEWTLCLKTRDNERAHDQKKWLIDMGLIARVQYVYEDENIYYVWKRFPAAKDKKKKVRQSWQERNLH